MVGIIILIGLKQNVIDYMIKLEPITHTYYNDEKPFVKYTSVTTVIGSYEVPFDTEFHANRIAEIFGKTKEQVIAEWEEKSRLACDFGTYIHETMERFLLSGKKTYSPRDPFEIQLISEFKNMCFQHDLSVLKNPVKPEYIMSIEFNDGSEDEEGTGIAGTADVIEDVSPELFNIWDFKTNEDFTFDDKYMNYFKYPLTYLMQSKFNIYTIQLSLYAYMYELETGKKLNRIGIFYWDRLLETFTLIPIFYAKKEVELLLQHYKINLN